MGLGLHRLFWKAIWKLKTLPKFRVFAWRLGHEILSTNVKIASIRQNVNNECHRCGAGTETLIHALKDCPTARAILTCGGLDDRLINNNYECCIVYIEESMQLLDKKAITDFITILWNSWNNSNNFIFHSKKEEARVIWERAITLSKDFRIHILVNKLMLLFSPSSKKWEKPLRGTVKLNFDVAVSNKKTGYRIIVRDHEGFIIGGSFGFEKEKMAIDWGELYAFKESFKLGEMMNITKATYETDCAVLTNKIKKRKDDITLMGYRINECFRNMDRLYNVDVKWANRTCNKVGDCLSKYVISNESHSVFNVDYPTFIHKLVIDDVIN